MDLERVLDERSADLTDALFAVGFSRDEASRFLSEAGPELVQSWEWRANTGGWDRPGVHGLAGDLLATISGRQLAERAGLPMDKTWTGLRELVPAVVKATAERQRIGSASTNGERDAGPAARMDVGFGLFLERAGQAENNRVRPTSWHPIFGRLLSQE